MQHLNKASIAIKLANGFYLAVFNIVLISIIGYLTLDSNANANSRTGAYLLSILIPYVITSATRRMNGIERLLKFGAGFIVYMIIGLIAVGLPHMVISGLLPCLLIATGFLYFGNIVLRRMGNDSVAV